MNKVLSLSLSALLGSSLMASDDTQTQIDELKAEVKKLKKIQSYTNKSLSKVKAHGANDNIKYGLEFRNAVDMIEYKDNDTGETYKNDNLLTSRLFLTMASTPMKGLMFKGKLAIYSMWGAGLQYDGSGDSAGLKDWSGSSKPSDTLMRIKEAYFVYKNKMGDQPYAFSIGRRPATNGFLANYRENEDKPGSPSAHITNMEVNGAMLKLSWNRFIPGAYTKFVYGRAHTGEIQGVYGDDPALRTPFAEDKSTAEDDNVDFFVVPGVAYNDGQYEVMYQWAHIFNTKGLNIAQADAYSADMDANSGKDGYVSDLHNGKKNASGSADLFSVGFKVDGIGDEFDGFLANTTLFVSGAYTNYSADDGYSILGSSDGGSVSGSSLWAGIIVPDMITDNGKIGFEYNQGSKNFTPMTWAEDTITGSKIAVRGYAAEAYWNFDLFGVKHLPSQVRYTYAQHDYTPNINCAGWVDPQEVDLTSSDLRVSVTYKY